MKTIQLHGELAEKFGAEPFKLDAKTPHMITRGMISRFGNEFRKIIADGTFEFLCINSDTGEKTYAHDDMTAQMTVDADEIHLTPVPAGSGRFGQIILGIILIVVGVIANFYPGGQAASGPLISAGIAMVAGGIVQLLFAPPTINNRETERPDARASYVFNGGTNTYEQGGPVPLVYGRTKAGTTIVSAGFSVEQLAYHIRCGRRYDDPDCQPGGPRRNYRR
jgi:predicted phage tail protein